MRALTANEQEQASGGVAPLIIVGAAAAGIAVGFALKKAAECAFGSSTSTDPDDG